MSKIVEKDFINDLYLFYRYFIASNYKDSVPAPHIHTLANKLMELALNDDGKHRLAVSMPPRHSKSSMVTLAFPLWLLFQDPNVNIMIVTGSPKLAEKFGIQLREYVRNLGHYFNVYLSNVKQASTHIMFCDKDNNLYKGNIMLASSGGGITGQDADYLILDDPYTGNDEEFTPSALQKKIDWINRVVEQRIEPHTKYCVLHTRWHPISMDCPVLTKNKGWVEHGDLEVGDEVFHPNGETTKVVKVHPPVTVNNCFEFSNGDTIISGDHHLWKMYDWGNRKERIMETQEIMGRKTLVGKKKSRSNFLVDNHEPLQYPYQEVPIDPYWLGLWLGDGHHKRPSIVVEHGDEEYCCETTPYNVQRYDTGKGNCYEAFYTHQKLTGKLRELNVYGDKHIPKLYLYNSYDVRMQLLAGLIDSDGSVEKKSKRVIFVNTNKKLLKQVHELMTGLGFNVKIEERPSDKINSYKENDEYNIVSRNDAYALRITPHLPIPTRIPRKKIEGVGVSKRIGLTDKYKVDDVWGNCITVEADDGMYLIGKNLTPTHNSHDIIGYYRENEEDSFDFIEFPAITDENEPLWKERYSMEDLLKKKKTVGERVFSSVYQQQPIDTTSDFFNMQHLKFGYPEDYEMKSTARAWDIASSDALSNNDFTAGVRMVRSGDNCIITDLVHGRFGNKTKEVIQTTAFKDTPTVHVVIETGVAGAGKLLFSEWKNQLKGFIVERAEVSGGKSKVDRATPFKNAIEDGKVYIAIEDETLRDALYNELTSFPVGEHDDITDACSHCYNYLFVDINKPKPKAKLGVVFL